jgi:hypothetical protein
LLAYLEPMSAKSLNGPVLGPPSAGLCLDDIVARLPRTERDAIRARTAELVLAHALKQKLAERATAKKK